MECDFAVQGALMPDAHTGYALPIGAVVATKDVVVPAWVGYDIGCGMCAVRTDLTANQVNPLEIYESIYKSIPVGFNKHQKAPPHNKLLDARDLTKPAQKIFSNSGAYHQLGTLGGGNHFIEISYDEQNRVWIVIHSGSRGVGHDIARHYMAVASPDGKPREGHFGLSDTSPEGKAYLNDLCWCLFFALENRKTMVQKVLELLGATQLDFINRNHNHVEKRKSDGLWIHRKGATHAELDMMGVIPGNMRDGSFVVRGLGNEDSLCSSSHGAGRVLSRSKAKEELDYDEFLLSMEGIQANTAKAFLDEAPGAYKDIFEVMSLQSDLVETLHHLKPIVNIKG
jgi:tRNA-splicing ligase RtcB